MSAVLSRPPLLSPWPATPRTPLVGPVAAVPSPHDLRVEELAQVRAGAWFSALSPEVQQAVLGAARVSRVAAGAVLGRRCESARYWVGVAAGAVRLGTALHDGRMLTLDILGPGQWFGDIALLDDGPQDLDLTAQVPSTLLLVPRAELRRLTAESDELSSALMKLNCQRLRHMFRRFEELHTLPLAQRLARQVVRLARRFGRPQGTALRIDLRISQADLAALVGGSRQRVNAALRQMQADGLLLLGEARLAVLDLSGLTALAYDEPRD
ncbi:MAG TPA: Crp/Fnr family transcriptional regulator [Burkholderiaceae bacterium]|nr:Crp/Fnr family transcriptional regulator [Burkholderiaceae bacterium]